jgi:hypothetical protein
VSVPKTCFFILPPSSFMGLRGSSIAAVTVNATSGEKRGQNKSDLE